MAGEQQPFLQYSDDSSSVDEHESGRHGRHVKTSWSIFLSHFLVFLLTSSLWVAISFAIAPASTNSTAVSTKDERHNVTSNAWALDCGDSVEEARELGCAYDVLLNHWVPAPCVDDEFVKEYQDDGSWAAYYDEGLTHQIMTIDEMSEQDIYYTSVRDHINHCAVVWKKQFYMLFEERQAFDSVIVMPYHTDHCAQYLTEVSDRDWNSSTRVEVGFAGCWIRE
ncbi:uncharacterized protein A1O9_11756 [Exophiala aquamarina CBS 119918]|uniref:Uncharacterized protein n=1 Tax=Exophiala aquamarina CBS 119918 TaxID=1182545 RepID=A0A072P961_9EURO|nr:uncharacterized protein A1O9_11756 [Exophiala aquamarina CBS 119918]KEF52130.1 hypothetical protein A1O9_11756 [Exophiala aquamarina CBS 119918]